MPRGGGARHKRRRHVPRQRTLHLFLQPRVHRADVGSEQPASRLIVQVRRPSGRTRRASRASRAAAAAARTHVGSCAGWVSRRDEVATPEDLLHQPAPLCGAQLWERRG